MFDEVVQALALKRLSTTQKHFSDLAENEKIVYHYVGNDHAFVA